MAHDEENYIPEQAKTIYYNGMLNPIVKEHLKKYDFNNISYWDAAYQENIKGFIKIYSTIKKRYKGQNYRYIYKHLELYQRVYCSVMHAWHPYNMPSKNSMYSIV